MKTSIFLPVEFVPEPCDSDPLLQFNFNGDFNDCNCQKAIGTPMGDVRLTLGLPNSPSCPSNNSCDPYAPNCAVCFGQGGGNVEVKTFLCVTFQYFSYIYLHNDNCFIYNKDCSSLIRKTVLVVHSLCGYL